MKKNSAQINKYLFQLMILVFLVGVTTVKAQVANYCFSQSNGTYTAISGGTSHGTTDDAVYTGVAIGFTFNFNGTNYTTCAISSNGFITFGGTNPAATYYTPISGGTAYNGAVSAAGHDGIPVTSLRSQLFGSAPNRTFVIQWAGWDRYNGATQQAADDMNFQIILYETSNKIDIVYGPNACAATAITVQVGLRGTSNADFNNRKTAPWASTVAGTASSDNVNTQNTSVPASGLTFTYNPPPPAPGNPTSNSPQCIGSGVTLTESGSAPAGVTWYWQGTTSSGTSTVSNGTSTFNAASSGTYYIRAQDNTTTCWSGNSGSLAVVVNPLPQGSFTGNSICTGGTGQLTWTATAGTGPYTVVYNPGGISVSGVVSGTPFNASPNPTATSTYTVTSVTDAGGCIRNGSFTGATATITVNAAPTTSDAGDDQTIAANTTTMAGNTPSVGTGAWTLVSGSGTITTPSSPTSGITGLGTGTNTFRWTISNGTCTSTDDVIIYRYCASNSTTPSASEQIRNVTFNTINNTSSVTTCVSYTDFTSINTTVLQGSSYSFSTNIVSGSCFNNNGFPDYYAVYIDWNRNGVFTDAGEKVFSGNATLPFTASTTIAVPAGATPGSTVMRVIALESGPSPASCGTYTYGETEDYTIIIGIPVQAGSSYGIYSPDATSGIVDCQIYATAGSGVQSGTGCTVCHPASAGFTSKDLVNQPVITIDNVNCLNTTLSNVKGAENCTSLGSGATSVSPALPTTSTPITNQYNTTGRKTIAFSGGGTGDITTQAAQTFPSGAVNAAITDWTGNCGTYPRVQNTIAVNGYTNAIATSGISVTVNINHLRDGDLELWLVAPNGAILGLSQFGGGTGDNYVNTVFSDAGGTNITAGAAPFTGTYRPEGPASVFCTPIATTVTTFAGIGGGTMNPNGNWILNVSDATAGTAGTLTNWSISFPSYIGPSGIYKTYTDFTNMMMAPPSPGVITGTNNSCPGTYSFASSVAGTPGFTYAWTVNTVSGNTPTIASSSASSTNITFPNNTAGNLNYTVTLNVTSECCGPLPAVTFPVTIFPLPVAPTASAASSTPCPGSTDILTASAPAGASFSWYTASSGGTLLGTGASYTVNPVIAGSTTYYAEATSANGCVSATRTGVTVTGTATPAPSTVSGSACGAGNITMSISSPGAGYTYNWYSGSCGGTLVQSSTSTSYTAFTASTTNYYVSATPPGGCNASSCSTVSATIGSPANPLVWLGNVGGANNWFNTANWTGGCLPTCSDNVRIPNLAVDPDIGYNASGAAACKDIDLQASCVLSFSDSKAELDICGNMTHSGILTTNDLGSVVFSGTAPQVYTRTGTGSFNNVVLNNTCGTPTLTLANDMSIGNTTTGTGAFTFQSGKVITNANMLIINNKGSASISGHSASKYVQGNLRRYINSTGPYDFPVGHSSKGYQNANVNFTSATTITYLTANFQTYATIPGPLNQSECLINYNMNALDNGFWQIDANVGAPNNSGTYNMTLYNTNYTNDASGWTVMSIHSGTTWGLTNGDGSSGTCVGGPVTAVVRNNMKGFSKFGNAQASAPLPVEILNFDALYNGSNVDVSWSTASEINNDFFIVERSSDLQNFTSIGIVDSKAIGGNSTNQLSYYLNDPEVNTGTYYYRLKQFDFNGSFKYSNIAVVRLDGENAVFTVKPNPTTSSAEIQYNCYSSEVAHLKVYDSRGRLIVSKELNCNKGQNNYLIDLEKEQDGMYYITLTLSHQVFKSKLIKNN